MKKFFAMLLALTMALSLAACGGGSNGGGSDTNDNSGSAEESKSVVEVYGLDLESTEEQPMSEERGEREALYTTVKDYFGDVMMFSGTDFAKMTYDDLKELLGVDATYYYYDENSSAQAFVWEASDKETAKLAFFFRFDELYALGLTNMK